MRKFLLLFSSLLISVSAAGQITQLYMEDFEDPNQVYQVVNGITTTPPGTPATIGWKDTTAHVVQGQRCYHVEGSSTLNDVWFETTDFSTIGFPYVFLTFTHVSKIFLANACYVEISTDQGNSWRILNDTAYIGTSTLYPTNEFFNEGAYFAANNLWSSGQDNTPDPSWWVQENFDLRGYAYDTINNVGFANVRFRFRARFNFDNPAGSGSFRDGWFIDTISCIGSVCELIPPTIDFNIGGSVCLDKPELGVVEDPSNSYPVSLLANDIGAGIDSVIVVWDNAGVIDTATMTLVNAGTGEYTANMTNVMPGDTVKWYVVATDLSCPNVTRSPDAFAGDYCFWIDSGLPAKCGSPFCGALPRTISSTNFPWTEDFEGAEWAPGNNGATAGTDNQHRGTFPIFPTDYRVVAPSTATSNQNRFAWSIANNSTSTALTGPNSNNTPGGGSKYIYTESSTSTSISSQLITPCIDLTQSTKCYAFEYYYHMFGSDISVLRIDIDTGSDGSAWYNGYDVIRDEQQGTSTEAWKRGIISLEPFNGQIIRIRMFARRANTTPFGDKSDVGIDDFRIFEPDPREIEMISFEAPVNGFCSYSPNDTVSVIVRSNGCSTTSAIPVGYEVSFIPQTGGPAVTTTSLDTIFNPLSLGDTIFYQFDPTVDLSSFGTYTIKAWSSMPGDNDPSNDTVFSTTLEHLPTISSFPFIEDFESGSVGLQSVGNNNWRFIDGLDPNFRWQIGDGLTITRQTGPLQGYHFGGKYLYTETNGAGQQVSTFFRSLCIDLSTMTNPTLDFYYHFYGSDIGGMEIQVSRSGEDLDTWTTITGSNVGVGQTEEKDNWSFKRVNLSAYVGESIKLRFKANRNAGTDMADMAIDKIMVYDRIANDAGVYLINRPNRGVITYNANPTSPEVQVTNFGTSTITNVEVKMDITPLCGPNQGVTTTYSETVSVTIAAGATVTLPALSSMNIAWPVGDFEMCAYTSLSGDNHSFNDTVCRLSNGLQIYNVPFAENFDPCDYDAVGFNTPASGTFYQWELGVPTASIINSAHSSPNVWATNLDGNYYAQTEEILTLPILAGWDSINFSEFRIWHWMDFDNNNPASSAGAIEFRQNNQWVPLGGTNINQNVGINWLGSQFGTQSSAVFNGPGFEGSSNGWIFSQYTMNEFNSTPNALFRSRLRFRSNDPITTPLGSTRNGWAIDDFELFVPGQRSASPIAIKTISPLPIPGQDQNFEITIKNTGAKVLDSCQIELIIDGALIGTIDFYRMPQFMVRGQTAVIDFNHPWPGNSVTSGSHDVMVITHLPSNRIDEIPFDDTLRVNIVVLDEVDMTTGMDSNYCNDFEGNDPTVFPWLALNSSTYNENHSWEKGVPTQFGTAYNGNNAWMTKLDSVYTTLDNSSLFSPIFIVDSGQTYDLSFYHRYDTEEFHDGGNIEISFDGGQRWDPVGIYNSTDSNWYNTQFVTALDVIKPGWTDTINNWKYADQRIAFQTDGIKAIFRFRFAADYDINRPGWAIDQFCFTKVDTNAQQVIGREEYALPEDLVIADLSPNPTNDFSELAIYSPTPKSGSYVIVNSIGQLMHSGELNLMDGVNKIQLDGSNWDSGIYVVRISIENELFTKKLVLTR